MISRVPSGFGSNRYPCHMGHLSVFEGHSPGGDWSRKLNWLPLGTTGKDLGVSHLAFCISLPFFQYISSHLLLFLHFPTLLLPASLCPHSSFPSPQIFPLPFKPPCSVPSSQFVRSLMAVLSHEASSHQLPFFIPYLCTKSHTHRTFLWCHLGFGTVFP